MHSVGVCVCGCLRVLIRGACKWFFMIFFLLFLCTHSFCAHKWVWIIWFLIGAAINSPANWLIRQNARRAINTQPSVCALKHTHSSATYIYGYHHQPNSQREYYILYVYSCGAFFFCQGLQTKNQAIQSAVIYLMRRTICNPRLLGTLYMLIAKYSNSCREH